MMCPPDRSSHRSDQDRLRTLLIALDASPGQLHRDECGDWQIAGRAGHVYADAAGFLVVVIAGSTRAWGAVKRQLDFCSPPQDGDTEGCLRLGRLPSPTEASAIRQALRLRKRRQDAPPTVARLRANPGIWGVSGSPVRLSAAPARKYPPPLAANRRAS
jgi:hypothetical protein